MNKTLLALLCGGALFAGPPAMAGQDTAAAPTRSAAVASELADDSATQACLEAFVHELIPGSSVRIHELNAAHNRVFDSSAISNEMSVHMSARSNDGGRELASGDCLVTRGAHIVSLYTRKLDPQRLARLAVHDLRLAAN